MTATTIDRHRPAAPSWSDLLSPREREVLRLVAQGRSNAEIAADLFISVTTVKTHVAQLLRKVRARDRVALVVAVHTSGFLGAPAMPARSRRCAAAARGRAGRAW